MSNTTHYSLLTKPREIADNGMNCAESGI